MVLDTLITDIATLQNLALIAVLIALFVVGYKLMQTLIQTGLMAVLSGVFLVALNMIGLGPEVTISRFLTFMVLGIALYMLYSSLQFMHTVASFAWSILRKIFSLVSMAFKGSGSSNSSRTRKRNSEKEVILKEMDD